MITIGLIFALLGVVCMLRALYHQDKLDEIREELDKREVQLDERANRLAADEQTLIQEWQLLRKAKEEMIEHAKRTARSTDHTRH